MKQVALLKFDAATRLKKVEQRQKKKKGGKSDAEKHVEECLELIRFKRIKGAF